MVSQNQLLASLAGAAKRIRPLLIFADIVMAAVFQLADAGPDIGQRQKCARAFLVFIDELAVLAHLAAVGKAFKVFEFCFSHQAFADIFHGLEDKWIAADLKHPFHRLIVLGIDGACNQRTLKFRLHFQRIQGPDGFKEKSHLQIIFLIIFIGKLVGKTARALDLRRGHHIA